MLRIANKFPMHLSESANLLFDEVMHASIATVESLNIIFDIFVYYLPQHIFLIIKLFEMI